MGNAQKQPTTRCRAFDQYNSTSGSTLAAAQQAEALRHFELGQGWQLLLTLRVPQQHAYADRTLLRAVASWITLCEAQLGERLRRSVYLHKRDDLYHAHIWSRYPRQPTTPEAHEHLLRCAWFASPALRGHHSQDPYLFHCQLRHQLAPGWGAYGVKRNTGAEAWIDDLSLPLHSWTRAIRNGSKYCAQHDK